MDYADESTLLMRGPVEIIVVYFKPDKNLVAMSARQGSKKANAKEYKATPEEAYSRYMEVIQMALDRDFLITFYV